MSDPVSNVEIEDVLSSIRRLVSEDSRTPEAKADAEPAPSDRLVLTPALRVSDPKPQPSEPLHPAFSEAPGPDEMRLTARLLPAEEELSSPAWRRASFAAVPMQPAEHAPEAPPQAEPAPDAPTAGAPLPDDAEEAAEAPFIEVTEEEEAEEQGASIADFFAAKLREAPQPQTPEPEPVADIAPKEGSLARKIAELEEMIARSTNDFEPETGEEAPEAIFRHQPAAPEASASAADNAAAPSPSAPVDEDAELARRPMPEPELVDSPFETDATGEAGVDDEEDAPFAFHRGTVTQPDESVEAPEVGAGANAEPEVSEDAATGPLSAPDMDSLPEVPKPSARRPVKILRNPVWQRSQSNLRREAEELAAAPATEAGAEPPLAASRSSDEEAEAVLVAKETPDVLAGLDADALRKLIAEVVREELQGALNDQVSRGLRRMVRREIQRIAMSADSD